MEGFFVLLLLLAVGCILCGPAALVIGIIALKRTKGMYLEPPRKAERATPQEVAKPAALPERLLAAGLRVESVRPVAASLEDVFIARIGAEGA